MTKSEIIQIILLGITMTILIKVPYCYDEILKYGDDKYISKKRKFSYILLIITIFYTIFLVINSICKGGEYMILESVFLTLILVVVLIRLYAVNNLTYMRENRIYDDKKYKFMKRMFIISDISLFILVITYIFIKGYITGIL